MLNRVGGTPGGLAPFLIGLAMAIAGAYLIANQVSVASGGWSIFGYNSFGLSLLPLLAGIAFLFFDGRSRLGWLLLFAGLVVIAAGILMNLTIYFERTSLFDTLMMLALLAGGLGLLARSLR